MPDAQPRPVVFYHEGAGVNVVIRHTHSRRPCFACFLVEGDSEEEPDASSTRPR